MGFIKIKQPDNGGGLIVSFDQKENTENFYTGDSVQEALEYFNMYVKNNQIFYHSNEEIALSTTGINSVEEAVQLREELDNITSTMTDEDAISHPYLFANWKAGIEYNINDRVRYAGRIFKVLQNHLSQINWTPSKAPSLFIEVLTSENGEPKEWQQPAATNPYLFGDKVIFNGQIYESLIDNNIWSPEYYPQGWQLIIEEQNEIKDWIQPNSTNPYMIDDKVRYNEHIYKSIIDNNIWSPDTYPAGWTLIE